MCTEHAFKGRLPQRQDLSQRYVETSARPRSFHTLPFTYLRSRLLPSLASFRFSFARDSFARVPLKTSELHADLRSNARRLRLQDGTGASGPRSADPRLLIPLLLTVSPILLTLVFACATCVWLIRSTSAVWLCRRRLERQHPVL
jgi:hypothetical protein